jgi:hypothetical protein
MDSIIDICARSAADDWIYWVYIPPFGGIAVSLAAAARGRASHHYARALYAKDVAVGIAWGTGDDLGALASPCWESRSWEAAFRTLGRYHWIDLLYDSVAIGRYLVVAVDGGRASLPVPRAVRTTARRGRAFWVPRHEYIVVRLANQIDPSCCDFDVYFERCGIEVR